jgi:hypothetical protein
MRRKAACCITYCSAYRDSVTIKGKNESEKENNQVEKEDGGDETSSSPFNDGKERDSEPRTKNENIQKRTQYESVSDADERLGIHQSNPVYSM